MIAEKRVRFDAAQEILAEMRKKKV